MQSAARMRLWCAAKADRSTDPVRTAAGAIALDFAGKQMLNRDFPDARRHSISEENDALDAIAARSTVERRPLPASDDRSRVAAQARASEQVASANYLADLLLRVAEGDREAFEDLHRRTSAKLFGVCVRILPTRAEAEDALQDVYCQVWRSAGTFDSQRGTAMTWLIKIARNRAIDQVRRSRRLVSVPIEFADEVADPHPLSFEILATGDEHRQMQRCLDLLSPRDAAAIKAAFLDGLKYADLAQAAGVTVSTMKTRMRRALLKLRDAMAAHDGRLTDVRSQTDQLPVVPNFARGQPSSPREWRASHRMPQAVG